jgi:hypothetical protein
MFGAVIGMVKRIDDDQERRALLGSPDSNELEA